MAFSETCNEIGSPVGEAAEWYATHRRWSVAPGTYRTEDGLCSCGDDSCPHCGAHPATPAWRLRATNRVEEIRAAWLRHPDASIVVPTGLLFDVLEVPAQAGPEALTRLDVLGYRLGPVAESRDGRLLLWVATGTRVLYGLGERRPWPFDHLGLHCLSIGDYVLAPPSAEARWVFAPAATGWHLPRADTIVATVASACRAAAVWNR